MAFIGKTYPEFGSCEIISHNSNNPAPHNMEAGKMTECLDDRNIPRAMWGTAIPINPIGPVKAVAAPANRLVATIIHSRVWNMDTPTPLA
jgi:hypothetical protein